MADIEEPEERQVRPFAQFVQEQRNGGLHGELSEVLAALNSAVILHQKKGTLTVTITIAPTKHPAMVEVTDEVKAKIPEADRGGALFYVDEEGNMHRSNPQQPSLPLREAGPITRIVPREQDA